MKHLRSFGTLLALVLTAVALAGVGTASATELYAGNTTVPAGTTFHITMEPGTSALASDTSLNPIDTCTTTTVHGTWTTTGSPTTTPLLAISSLTNGGAGDPCTQATSTLTNGNMEIHHIAGTDNGTVTSSGTVVQLTVFGISCNYGTGPGTDLGILTGKTNTSEHATVDVNAIINEQEPKKFLCPDTSRWIGSYIITSPTGLNVRAS